MQIKNKINEIGHEKVSELRKNLRRGDAFLISEMLDGLYQPTTINKMILGHRKMKPIVYDAANRLIATINNLKSELK